MAVRSTLLSQDIPHLCISLLSPWTSSEVSKKILSYFRYEAPGGARAAAQLESSQHSIAKGGPLCSGTSEPVGGSGAGGRRRAIRETHACRQLSWSW